MIRVLVAEDQAMVRDALKALLALETDIEIVADAGNGEQAIAEALRTQPDVALLDIEMPAPDGLAVAGELHTRLPSCRVVILTTFGRPGYLKRAMESGALGYLLKAAPARVLADAIRRCANGERVVDPALAAAALADGVSPLSPRERDVLIASVDGASVAEIAERLFLSQGTVRNYISAVIQKLDARNRADAVRIAQEKGWL